MTAPGPSLPQLCGEELGQLGGQLPLQAGPGVVGAGDHAAFQPLFHPPPRQATRLYMVISEGGINFS